MHCAIRFRFKYLHSVAIEKQDRIHDDLSRLWVSRSGWAGTVEWVGRSSEARGGGERNIGAITIPLDAEKMLNKAG